MHLFKPELMQVKRVFWLNLCKLKTKQRIEKVMCFTFCPSPPCLLHIYWLISEDTIMANWLYKYLAK